jgi:hypothetical protein
MPDRNLDMKFTTAGDFIERVPEVTISLPQLGIRNVEIDGTSVAYIQADHEGDGWEVVSDDYEWIAECGHPECKCRRMWFETEAEALEFARNLAEKIK